MVSIVLLVPLNGWLSSQLVRAGIPDYSIWMARERIRNLVWSLTWSAFLPSFPLGCSREGSGPDGGLDSWDKSSWTIHSSSAILHMLFRKQQPMYDGSPLVSRAGTHIVGGLQVNWVWRLTERPTPHSPFLYTMDSYRVFGRCYSLID